MFTGVVDGASINFKLRARLQTLSQSLALGSGPRRKTWGGASDLT